ncbi:hypothetical protein GQ57_24590 [Burkholderia sp. MSh2]|uniref:Uncharacterized protein n=1 Tax=Burkholderia paludis TaxID=1506587 RepID=A0A6J5ENU1_9BURK|nr:hypothetical protein GQ57_24590 [Burkholderia sp. MSh2]CAB3766685.1 hypothetical protein LMG30113_05298 [Burkholderia paludis]VWC27207.1 hypothetical protein BPA30113_06068 [Burkholderia paludis]
MSRRCALREGRFVLLLFEDDAVTLGQVPDDLVTEHLNVCELISAANYTATASSDKKFSAGPKCGLTKELWRVEAKTVWPKRVQNINPGGQRTHLMVI